MIKVSQERKLKHFVDYMETARIALTNENTRMCYDLVDSLKKGNSLEFQAIACALLSGHCFVCYTDLDETWKKWCQSCWHEAE